MATINIGSIKFKWKGTYNALTAYTVDDVVEYNGSSYICILASTGNLPTNATYFEQMSQAGTNGTDGTDLTSTLTTQGDIVYRNASGLARLGAGTSGQVLQTGGTGANPSWVDTSGGLVQVKYTRVSTGQTLASTGFNDLTGLSLNITPSSASNKILVTATVQGEIPAGNRGWRARIIRAATSVHEEGNEKAIYSSTNILRLMATYQYLDSPNTTSSTNYQIQVQQDGGGAINYQNGAFSTLTLMEVSV
jgi:hypothetical protein